MTNSTVISSIAGCVPASAAALNSTNPCAGHNLGKSPAELAGLKPNDKIVSVAGKPIRTWPQLHTVLKGQKAGVRIPMVVQRAGRDVTVYITPKAIPKWPTPYLGVQTAVQYQRLGFLGSVKFAGDPVRRHADLVGLGDRQAAGGTARSCSPRTGRIPRPGR